MSDKQKNSRDALQTSGFFLIAALLVGGIALLNSFLADSSKETVEMQKPRARLAPLESTDDMSSRRARLKRELQCTAESDSGAERSECEDEPATDQP